MTEKSKTPRWRNFLSILGNKTRFKESDVKIIKDEHKDCAVTIHQEQIVRAERRHSKGFGKSGVQLAADKSQLDFLAEEERKRLQNALPAMAEQWLCNASQEAQKMPANGELDKGVKAFGIDSECKTCNQAGYIPCTNCKCTGKNTCPRCIGVKKISCSFCGGGKTLLCTSCQGYKSHECNSCSGSGAGRCYSGCDNGKVNCDGCGGRGRINETVMVDHGKGPAMINRDVTCRSCNGYGKVSCRSCGGTPPPCPRCSGRKKIDCETCAATGNILCSNCNEAGMVNCSTCNASGLIDCGTCKGEKKLACSPCGTRGWTHVREDIFTRLILKQRIEHSAETPADWRQAIEASVGYSNASMAGKFSLVSQALLPGPEISLSRTWGGSVPIWDMQVQVNESVASMFAVGNEEDLVGENSAIQDILTADRTRVIDAARVGGKSAQKVIKEYLTTDEHVQSVLLHQKHPKGEFNQDVRSAFSIVQSYFLGLERRAKAVAWTLYLGTLLPLLMFLLSGTRFRYDWIATLLWPAFVAFVHFLIRRVVIPRQLLKFTQNRNFSDSWVEYVFSQENSPDSPKRRNPVKYIALTCAAVILLTSTGKPQWLVEPISEFHLWRAQSISPQDREKLYADEITSWLRCDARHEDKLLAALKGMEKDGLTKSIRQPVAKFNLQDAVWTSSQLKILDFPVRKITYYKQSVHGDHGQTKVTLEIYLDAGISGFKSIANQIHPDAEPLKTPYGTIKEILEFKSNDYSWSVQLKKEPIYQDMKNGKGSGKQKNQSAEIKESSTTFVKCTVYSDDWLRIKK